MCKHCYHLAPWPSTVAHASNYPPPLVTMFAALVSSVIHHFRWVYLLGELGRVRGAVRDHVGLVFSVGSVKSWGRNEKAGSPAKARCVKRVGIT